MSVVERFFLRTPVGHAPGQFGHIRHECLIFLAPEDDYFVFVHLFLLNQLVFYKNVPNLLYLVRLSVVAFSLKVDQLLDPRLRKHVMTSTCSFFETETQE